MRPNYAMDAPPTEITVGGFAFPVNVDYRVWIEITRLFRDYIPEPEKPEHIEHNIGLIEQIETLALGGVVQADPGEVLKALAEFAGGYPTAPMRGEDGPPCVSFEYDLNEIIIAIRNQSGIDLSYRRKEPFHWWEFLLEFRTLCGEHYILNLMEARSYKGKDPEMIKRRNRCALPVEHTASEQAILEDINAEFYNA